MHTNNLRIHLTKSVTTAKYVSCLEVNASCLSEYDTCRRKKRVVF